MSACADPKFWRFRHSNCLRFDSGKEGNLSLNVLHMKNKKKKKKNIRVEKRNNKDRTRKNGWIISFVIRAFFHNMRIVALA